MEKIKQNKQTKNNKKEMFLVNKGRSLDYLFWRLLSEGKTWAKMSPLRMRDHIGLEFKFTQLLCFREPQAENWT